MIQEFSDLADSPKASYSHHPQEDLEPQNSAAMLAGHIKDAILPLRLPQQSLILQAVDAGVEEAQREGWESDSGKESLEAICEVLQYLKDCPNTRLYTYALLMVLGKCDISEKDLADKVGVTKACVSKIKTTVQDHYGVPVRMGRDQKSRRLFAQLRIEQSMTDKPQKASPWEPRKLFQKSLKSIFRQLQPA